jgi:anti-sigma B factor antagonist
MELLTVLVSVRPSYVLVRLAGEADMTVCGRLREALVLAVRAGARDLVVDVPGLRFIDVSRLRVLVRVCGMVGESGGTLGLVAPQPVVVRMMQLCGADRLIAVHGSVAEAAARRAPPDPGSFLVTG